MTASDRDPLTVEGVQAAHQFVVRDSRMPRDVGCTCGWTQPSDDHNAARHAAHVAEALEPVIRAREAAAWDEGYVGFREDARACIREGRDIESRNPFREVQSHE